MKQEKPAGKHQNRYGAQRDIEIPPAHVLCFVATGNTRSRYITRGFVAARIVRNEAPGNCDKISRFEKPLLRVTDLLSDAINCPRGHHTESSVSMPPDAMGRNSRKRAPSTGRLPPIPMPNEAKSAQVPIQVLPPPTARPKTPAINSVELKASRRPMTSDAIPQKDAPIQSPRNVAHVV